MTVGDEAGEVYLLARTLSEGRHLLATHAADVPDLNGAKVISPHVWWRDQFPIRPRRVYVSSRLHRPEDYYFTTNIRDAVATLALCLRKNPDGDQQMHQINDGGDVTPFTHHQAGVVVLLAATERAGYEIRKRWFTTIPDLQGAEVLSAHPNATCPRGWRVRKLYVADGADHRVTASHYQRLIRTLRRELLRTTGADLVVHRIGEDGAVTPLADGDGWTNPHGR